ncbi:hypothetical protein ACOI9H_01695 [Corynebacterium striatum]
MLDELVALFEQAGVTATLDARNLDTPGIFLACTRLQPLTMAGAYRATVEAVAAVADLGGVSDVANLSALVDSVLSAVEISPIEIDSVDMNHQATPPSGGVLPAARITLNVPLERISYHGNS